MKVLIFQQIRYTDDIEVDAIPEAFHDRLGRTRADIGKLVGDKVSRKSGGNECIWEVIVNHTAPELAEVVKDAQKEKINNIGYKNIKELLVAEKFEQPNSASDNGASNSATSLRPTDIDECTFLRSCGYNLLLRTGEEVLRSSMIVSRYIIKITRRI